MDEFAQMYEFIKRGDYDAALALLLDPNTGRLVAPFNRDVNHAWYVVGDILFKKEDCNGAIKAFKKSLRTRRDDVEALWAIGECYSMLKRPSLAERYFRNALSYADDKEELIYNLGNALFDQGKYEASIAQYEKISRKNRELFGLAQKNIKVARRNKT